MNSPSAITSPNAFKRARIRPHDSGSRNGYPAFCNRERNSASASAASPSSADASASVATGASGGDLARGMATGVAHSPSSHPRRVPRPGLSRARPRCMAPMAPALRHASHPPPGRWLRPHPRRRRRRGVVNFPGRSPSLGPALSPHLGSGHLARSRFSKGNHMSGNTSAQARKILIRNLVNGITELQYGGGLSMLASMGASLLASWGVKELLRLEEKYPTPPNG